MENRFAYRIASDDMPMVPQQPVVKFFSPQKEDQGLIELHDTTTTAYLPIDLGTPHASTRDYPGFKLGKQFNLPNDHRWVVRIWVKDTTNPKWFAYSVKFLSESVDHPIFIRQSRELRKTYVPKAKGQPLKAVYKLTLGLAGSNYIPGTFPVLTFNNSGAGGTGVAGHGIVNPDGSLADLILDESGSGYTAAPTFTIEAPGAGGVNATGSAVIQPDTALLVAEQADEFPDDSEFKGLYLNVTRVYQTLPGPIITLQSIGHPNVVPERYRSLVRREETTQEVNFLTYDFPDNLSDTQVLISLQQETIATAVLKIVSEVVDTITKLQGQDTDPKLGIPIPYTEQLTNDISTFQNNPAAEITPLSTTLWVVKLVDSSALLAALADIIIVTPDIASFVRMPDILLGIKIIWDYKKGSGKYVETGGNSALTVTSRTMSTSGDAQGSATVMPDIVPDLITTEGRNIPLIKALFFLPIPVTIAQVLTKINALLSPTTVVDWPQFGGARHQITATGGSLSLSARTKAHYAVASDNITNVVTIKGEGYSEEVGVSQRTATISNVIHDDIDITLDTNGLPLTPITVHSHSEAIPEDPGVTYVPGVIADVQRTGAVGLSIKPAHFAATSTTTIPTSGIHLWGMTSEVYRAAVTAIGGVTRVAMINAELIDMSAVVIGGSGAGTGALGTPVCVLSTATPSGSAWVVTGTINPNGLVTSWQVDYGLTQSYELGPYLGIPVAWGTITAGSSPISLNTLAGGVVGKTVSAGTYWVRLRATNALGTSFSEEKQVLVT